jgi:TonB-dependent receptor
MRTLTLVYLFVLLPFTGLFAQNGTIAGTITDKTTGEGMFSATVQIEGTSIGTITDFDGKYALKNIKPGTYKVRVYAITYTPVIVSNVKVEAGKTVRLDAALQSSDRLLEGAVIYADKPTATIAAGVQDQKKADQVVNVLTGTQIRQGNDQNAAEAVKRVPGVTVVNNQFVVVRGLSERYNAVMLNNIFAPSVEADVKAFSFDLVPSGLIDRFMVYKSPSPDLPGEFSGGAIKIYTTNIPDSSYMSFSIGTGIRSGTTFEDFKTNKGSKTDWLGFDNGYRELPDGLPDDMRLYGFTASASEVAAASKLLRNDWEYESKSASPDKRFNIVLAKRVSITKDSTHKYNWQFGNITALNYSNTNAFMTSQRLDYNTFDPISQISDTVFNYSDRIYSNKARVGIMQNNALRLGKRGQHRLELKNLLNQIGDNETTLRGGSNIEFGETRREYAYHYTEKTIYSGQLGGQHEFNMDTISGEAKTKLDWTAGYAASRRNEPDWRRARYSRNFDTLSFPDYTLYLPNTATPFFLGRIFVNMKEDTKAGSVNAEHKFTYYDKTKKDSLRYSFSVKGGMYFENKARTFNVRNLGYVPNDIFQFDWNMLTDSLSQIFENVNDSNGIVLDEDTKKADQYTASNRQVAAYAMGIFPLLKNKMRITGGVRIEKNLQELNSYKTNGNDEVNVKNDILSILPSGNISYNFTEKMLVRGGYGRTINRPEFREVAPLTFYDFIFNSIYVGNDSLKTPVIDNYDLRWELYPTPSENISLGVFYKNFTNPIEIYFVPGVGSGGTRSFTWGNAPQARSYGAELEIRQGLDSLTSSQFVHDITLVANASYIKSEITLTNDTATSQANLKKRPMMGQSPYIANAGIYYQNDSIGLQVNVVYNIVGPRVVIVGIPGLSEVYEMPRNHLDLTLIKTFGKKKNIEGRIGVQDVFNAPFLLLQDANEDGKLDRETDQRIQYYKRGTYYTVGFTVRI